MKPRVIPHMRSPAYVRGYIKGKVPGWRKERIAPGACLWIYSRIVAPVVRREIAGEKDTERKQEKGWLAGPDARGWPTAATGGSQQSALSGSHSSLHLWWRYLHYRRGFWLFSHLCVFAAVCDMLQGQRKVVWSRCGEPQRREGAGPRACPIPGQPQGVAPTKGLPVVLLWSDFAFALRYVGKGLAFGRGYGTIPRL